MLEAARHTARADWSAVVLLSDEADALDLSAVCLGYPGLKLTLVRPSPPDDPLATAVTAGEKGPLWSVRSVPVRLNGSVAPRRVVLQQLCTSSPNLKRAVVKNTLVTQPEPSVVVRFSTEKRYLPDEAFDTILKSPGQGARSWLQHLGGRELGSKCLDS